MVFSRLVQLELSDDRSCKPSKTFFAAK